MAETFYDSAVDPFNSDAISEYYHLQSTGYAGSWSPITIPAANFPVVTPTRIFATLPMRIDQSDLSGTRPIALKIGAETLTRVTAAPSSQEYRLAPTGSERRDVVEVHISRAAASLDFDFYGTGSMFNAGDFNNIDITGSVTAGSTITTSGNITSTGTMYPIGGYKEVNGTALKYYYCALPIWDMDTDATKTILLLAGTGIAWNQILDIKIMIKDDALNATGNYIYYNLSAGGYAYSQKSAGGIQEITATRTGGGLFDSASFGNAIVRGTMLVIYY